MATETLYKVLSADGKPLHGGGADFVWPLPKEHEDGSWIPGEWAEVDGPLILCQHGLHLTTAPLEWWKPDALVYVAEYEGESIYEGGDKRCVRRARLLCPADWAAQGVYTSGRHSISSGRVYAYDLATVEASGSATVRAYDSATVEAYGSATVRAYGSATVRAYDSATVRAYDSATVRAYGSATVRAYDSATVEASGLATVEASGSATVISTHWHLDTAQVALRQMAAHVDRRGGKVVCRVAEATNAS